MNGVRGPKAQINSRKRGGDGKGKEEKIFSISVPVPNATCFVSL